MSSVPGGSERSKDSSLKKMHVQGLNQADKGFVPKDVGGTNIIQECKIWQWDKEPKLLKNYIKKMLSWGYWAHSGSSIEIEA